jgi:hypothetical protein
MNLEKNKEQLQNSDLLELPPAYEEVGTSIQAPVNEKNKNDLNNENNSSNNYGNSERYISESGFKPADRGPHPASFLFGIPIIGMLARKAVQLEHRMSEQHHGHHGHYGNHWVHQNHHPHSHHSNGFDMNPFDNHHNNDHMNPFGFGSGHHEGRRSRHQRRMERRERRCNRKMERDLARDRKNCC